MRIRTITAGAREADIAQAAAAAQRARALLQEAGYEVQTLRLAVAAGGANVCGDFATIARGMEERALEAGFDQVSLGPLAGDRLEALPAALAATEAVFASAHLLGPDGRVFSDMLQASAQAIVAIGAATPDGLGNLRFAALAGVAPGSPFFPASHHDGGAPWIAVGTEASALAVAAAETASASQRLTLAIEQHDAQIGAALAGLEQSAGVRFAGCDWSLAPYPDAAHSIGAAIEAISGVLFGEWGTLAAVRELTAAIRAARVTQLGFSGVMLPVLEDTVLAQRNSEGRYTLRDLLAFSAVCGTGLDTIPLPGDISAAQVAGILLEVATLASALRKPLTARLVPLPGLRSGDVTRFDSLAGSSMAEYFCSTRVM